eukprot:Gb_15838 [translate_table: standard]
MVEGDLHINIGVHDNELTQTQKYNNNETISKTGKIGGHLSKFMDYVLEKEQICCLHFEGLYFQCFKKLDCSNELMQNHKNTILETDNIGGHLRMETDMLFALKRVAMLYASVTTDVDSKGSSHIQIPAKVKKHFLNLMDYMGDSNALSHEDPEEENSCSGSISTSESVQHCRQDRDGQVFFEGQIVGRQGPSQYKGVVPQHNGKWGAQIYTRHQRVWLSTFHTEEAAALAYDRASIKFRGKEGPRNFLNAQICQAESCFQDLYTNEQIVQMIKDHSYEERLQQTAHFSTVQGWITRDQTRPNEQQMLNLTLGSPMMHGISFPRQHLFDKEVTPSDVGKLNRLVIPKQHAERYFPMDSLDSDTCFFLTFEEPKGQKWMFRYSFWKSSQSYVLTRGWSKFVKEKNLEAGDIVSFARGSTKSNHLFYIAVHRPSNSRRYSYQHMRSNFNSSPSNEHNKANFNFMYARTLFPEQFFWGLNPSGTSLYFNDDKIEKHFSHSTSPHLVLSPPQTSGSAATSVSLKTQNKLEIEGNMQNSVVIKLAPDRYQGPDFINQVNCNGNSIRLFGIEIGSELHESEKLHQNEY